MSEKMTYQEKLEMYAGAKRASAIEISQFVDGEFCKRWLGRLSGRNVTMDSSVIHTTRSSAIEDARRFRQSCRDELASQD